jgi:hypothetical protein
MMQFGDYCGTTVIHNAGPLRMGKIFTDLKIAGTHLGCLDGRSEFQSVYSHQNTATPPCPFRGCHIRPDTANSDCQSVTFKPCLRRMFAAYRAVLRVWCEIAIYVSSGIN